MPGISAISCPIFGQNGEIIAALTVVTLSHTVDFSEQSDAVKIVKQTGLELSKAVGYKQN